MIFGRRPAFWIGLIVSLVLAIVQTIAGHGLISDALKGQVENLVNALGEFAILVAPFITGLLIHPNVTPVAAPKLPQGTEVQVEGTERTVTIDGAAG